MHRDFFEKTIWIYGIGSTGRRICQIFQYFKIYMKGILVSDASCNISDFMGIPVIPFQQCSFTENDLIIVAVNKNVQHEIISNIQDKGIHYIVWTPALLNNLWKNSEYIFENRMQGMKKICIVLAGYKNYLWKMVFERLRKFVSEDVDICLCSAGCYKEELSEAARIHNWSYLSTKMNSVSLIQNICIALYENAEWCYKMDEDMFVTSGMFENMYHTAKKIIDAHEYDFGCCTPVIPVNGIGYRYILKNYNMLEEYEKKFGYAVIGGNPYREIEKNPEAARFMWSAEGIPQIDRIAKDMLVFNDYEICNTRLSIGCILFKRQLWEEMQGLVVYGNRDLGVDEEDINSYCINHSKVMAISLNALAAHFSFGRQTASMKEFFDENADWFHIVEE